MKTIRLRPVLVTLIAASVIVAGLALLGEIWLDMLDDDVFIKVLATCLVVAVVSAILLAMSFDLNEDKKLKDQGFLD